MSQRECRAAKLRVQTSTEMSNSTFPPVAPPSPGPFIQNAGIGCGHCPGVYLCQFLTTLVLQPCCPPTMVGLIETFNFRTPYAQRRRAEQITALLVYTETAAGGSSLIRLVEMYPC